MDIAQLIEQFAPHVVEYLTGYLQRTNPALLALVVPTGLLVRKLVQIIRAKFAHLQGNVIQTIAAGVAVAVVSIQASLGGVFRDGTNLQEITGLLVVSVMAWFGGIALNEIFKNQNKPAGGEAA